MKQVFKNKAGISVAPEVFTAIKREYRQTYPWLEHPRELIGKVLQGKDNARDSVAVWPDFGRKVSKFSIFIGGLSGEITSIANPLFVPGRSDPEKMLKEFVLRKTKRIKYCLPTDPANRERIEPARCGQPAIDWIMR